MTAVSRIKCRCVGGTPLEIVPWDPEVADFGALGTVGMRFA